jgi:hypothetical protein
LGFSHQTGEHVEGYAWVVVGGESSELSESLAGLVENPAGVVACGGWDVVVPARFSHAVRIPIQLTGCEGSGRSGASGGRIRDLAEVATS